MKPRAGQIRVDPTGLIVVTSTDVQAALAELDTATAAGGGGGGGGGSVGGELVMQDGVSSPPVPVETEDGTDWLYADGAVSGSGVGDGIGTVVATTVDYAAANGDIVLAGAALTVTLPGALTSAWVTVKNTGPGTVTIDPAGATLDDLATVDVPSMSSVTAVSDGTDWFVV